LQQKLIKLDKDELSIIINKVTWLLVVNININIFCDFSDAITSAMATTY